MSDKHEIPNSKFETSTNDPSPKSETGSPARRQCFGHSSFGFVSDFGFRVSDFPLALIAVSFSCLSLSCRVEHARDPRWAQIDAAVQKEIQAGHLPGAVVLVGQGNRVLYHKAFGLAVAEPFQEPMQKDTIFDLAL
jgi:CubicO group peptidase (beta-lactamase class C family)